MNRSKLLYFLTLSLAIVVIILNLSIKLESNNYQKSITRKRLNRTVASLVMLTQSGYANKIYTIISTITIGFITDSEIYIEMDYLDSFIQTPFSNKTFKNLTDIRINSIEIIPRQRAVYPKNLTILITSEVPDNFKYLLYQDCAAYFIEICSNPKYHKKLVELNLVEERVVKEAQIAINNTKMLYEERIEKVLQVGFDVASYIYNNYWKLRPPIPDIINKYYQDYFRDNYVIGIHLRSDHLFKSDIPTFINCALNLEYDYIYLKKGTKNTKWFITTDMNDLYDNFTKLFNNKVFMSNGTATHMGLYKENGALKALVDLELLGLCDEFITTGGSTFGFLPQIKTKTFSYYVNGRRNSKSCQRLTLSKPSLLPWFEGGAVF